MQAEYPPLRLGGFIVTPENANEHFQKEGRAFTHGARKRNASNFLRNFLYGKTKEFILSFTSEYKIFSKSFSRLFISKALSFFVAVCCVMVFFSYFSFGTAVYHNKTKIAEIESGKDFYNALAAANTIAEENNIKSFSSGFTLSPAIVLRKNILNIHSLRDEILLCSSSFKRACALYSGTKPLFYAENEESAHRVLSSFIKENSMGENASLSGDITFKECVVSKEKISSEENAASLLSQNSALSVISVVSTSTQKEIPFETTTIEDSDMYIGESVTVTEGRTGNASLVHENTYLNKMHSSSRLLSENITAMPVSRVVRVGTKQKEVLKTGVFYPLSGVISSPFGKRWGKMHEGLDIAVEEGTPVLAAECGKVSYVNENAGGYGKFIRIDHGYGVETAYAHLSKIEVYVGQSVNAQTRIALSGNTGRSTGPHLHFEITQNDTPLDPTKYLKKR